ncbi:MAG: hypothetical protein EZS28_008652, partial [Streblomastix strix]
MRQAINILHILVLVCSISHFGSCVKEMPVNHEHLSLGEEKLPPTSNAFFPDLSTNYTERFAGGITSLTNSSTCGVTNSSNVCTNVGVAVRNYINTTNLLIKVKFYFTALNFSDYINLTGTIQKLKITALFDGNPGANLSYYAGTTGIFDINNNKRVIFQHIGILVQGVTQGNIQQLPFATVNRGGYFVLDNVTLRANNTDLSGRKLGSDLFSNEGGTIVFKNSLINNTYFACKRNNASSIYDYTYSQTGGVVIDSTKGSVFIEGSTFDSIYSNFNTYGDEKINHTESYEHPWGGACVFAHIHWGEVVSLTDFNIKFILCQRDNDTNLHGGSICAIIEEGGSLRVLNGIVYSSKLSPRGDCKGGFIYIESKAPHGSASDFTLYNLNMSYCTANHGTYIFVNSSGPFNSASLGEKMMNIKIGYPSSEYLYEQTFDVRGGTWNETGNFTTIPVNQSYYSFSSDTIYAGQNDDDAIGNKLDCGINDTYRCRSLDAAIYKIQSRSGTRTINITGQADYGRNRYVDQQGKTLSIEGTKNATVVVHYTRVDTTNKWAALYIIGGTLQVSQVNFFVGGQRSGALFIVFGTTSSQANLKLTNSWITQNKTEDKYIIGDYYNGPLVQTFLTSVTLNGCWFENISTRSMLTNATMNTLGLWDNKYYDNQMGAALSVVNGPLSVNHTWFTNCSLIGTTGSNPALIGGSALYFDWSNVAANTLTVLDSRFYDCTVTFENNVITTSQTIGAAVRATLGGSGIKATFNDTKFYDNKLALGIGAGIYLNLSNTSTSSVVFSNCSLQGNTATQGAGITISGNPSANFNQCVFCTNVVTAPVLLGFDIYFNTASYSSTQHILNECYSSSDQLGSSRRISFATTSTLRIPDYTGQCPVKDYPTYDPDVPDPGDPSDPSDPGDTEHDSLIYVDYQNGEDSDKCSSLLIRCKTIGYALKLKLKENGTNYNICIISPNTQQEDNFSIIGKTVTLNKVNSTKPVINPYNITESTVLLVDTSLTLNQVILNHLNSTTLTSLITVNGANAELTLNNTDLKIVNTTVQYKPFIIGTRGKLILIYNSSISAVNLINIASINTSVNISNFTVLNSNFTNTKEWLGTEGGVVHSRISNNNVSFEGGNFAECGFFNYSSINPSWNSTRGGGIFIYLEDSFTWGQLSFKSSSNKIRFQGNNASVGRNIFVSAKSRDLFYNYALKEFEIDYSSDQGDPNNSAVVEFRDSGWVEPINVIKDFNGTTIYVNCVRGTDNNGCGSNTTNCCFSINRAKLQLLDNNTENLNIIVDDQAELNENYVAVNYRGGAVSLTIHPLLPQVLATIYVREKTIGRAGDQTPDSSAIAYLDSNCSVTLQYLIFKLGQNVQHRGLIRLNNGESWLTITRCFIQGETPLMRAVTIQSMFYIARGQLNISNSGSTDVLTNLASLGTNGTIFNAQLQTGMSALITNSRYTNNLIQSRYFGGAIYIRLFENSSVTFTNVSFDNNKKANGTIDHVYIESWSLSQSITADKIRGIFGINVTGALGYKGHDFDMGEVDLARFLYNYSANSVYVDEIKGNDTFNCGFKTNPCKTLGYSLIKASGDKQEVIVIDNVLIPERTEVDGQETYLHGISRTKPSYIYANHTGGDQTDCLIYITTSLRLERINVEITSASTLTEDSVILHSVKSSSYRLNFTECTFEGQGGNGLTRKAVIREIGGTLLITNCTFRNIYSSGSNENGGAFSVTLNSSTSSTSRIQRCVFDNCVTEQSYGGALYINLGGSSYNQQQNAGEGVIIDDCRFFRNKARSGGGAIRFIGSAKEFLITNCYFEDNQLTERLAGNDLLFNADNENWINAAHIINSSSNTQPVQRKIGGSRVDVEYLLPYTNSGNSTYYTLCNRSNVDQREFQNMPKLLEQLNLTYFAVYFTVNVEDYDSATDKQVGQNIQSRRIRLVNSNPGVPNYIEVKSNSTYMLRVEDKGVLQIESLTVHVGRTQKAFEGNGPSAWVELINVVLSPETGVINEEPYIQLTSGASLLLQQVEITASTFSHTPALDIIEPTRTGVSYLGTSSTIRIIDTEFHNIERQLGNGSVIGARFDQYIFLSVEGKTLFTNSLCNETNSKGGAVYLQVGEGREDYIFEKEVSFINNKVKIDENGSFIENSLFIDADSLYSRVTLDKLLFNLSQGVDETNFRGYDINLNEIPLYYLFNEYQASAIYVSDKTGVDQIWCGREVFPCKTIEYGHDKLNRSTLQQLNLVDTQTLTQILFLENNIILKSKFVRTPAQMSISGSGGFIVGGFIVGGLIQAPNVTINNIDFSITSELTEGVHVLDSTVANANITVSECIFVSGRPQRNIIATAGVIRVANAANVTIEKCEMYSILATTGNGVGISLINNLNALITECLFSGEYTEYGNGAGISVVLSNASHAIAIKRSRFINNMVRNNMSIGGGGIYFNISDYKSIDIDTCLFSENRHLNTLQSSSARNNSGTD